VSAFFTTPLINQSARKKTKKKIIYASGAREQRTAARVLASEGINSELLKCGRV
jgi:hypothetical protein